ncbi:MAG: hypothetical protein NTZ83_02440 [Candidatus Pacearchaeota archaeon]|nr:hypothetical protein [Candidatus Pacearchaeota archaeon]
MVKKRGIVKCKEEENKKFSHYNFIKNRRGWIRIVEVFVSIVLLTGILMVVITKGSSDKVDLQKEISNKEIAILRDIQLNTSLRTQILNVPSGSLPFEWASFSSELPDVRDRIIQLSPKDFDCRAKICSFDDACIMTGLSGEIYAESAFFSADLDTYSPRQLKLFCAIND